MAATERELRVGIVGLGHLHPRSYMTLFATLPQTKVVAVTEANAALRTPFCSDFGVAGYERLDAMLAAEQLDIATIFLPHNDCPAAAAACAAKGLHLMVEKPMAASAAGAQQILAAATQHRVQLTTGYCWRLHPVVAEIRRLIQAGVLGRLVGAEGRCAAGRLTRYLQGHSPWILEKARSGGGPMYNLGVHWIDLFRHILQDEVAEVSGRNVKINTEYDVEDNSFAHLRFRSGLIAALDISYTVPDAFPFGRDLFIAIRGTQGVLSWAPAYEGEKDVLHICSDHPDFAGAPRRQQVFELASVKGYSGIMGLEYLKRFVAAVRGQGTPPITGQDGVAALQVVEAIYAADQQKRWVSL